jgi:hypothetical protein
MAQAPEAERRVISRARPNGPQCSSSAEAVPLDVRRESWLLRPPARLARELEHRAHEL